MSGAVEDVTRPNVVAECTAEQILTGPPIDPCDRLKLYSDVKFEEFIAEWAFHYLQILCAEYVRVARFGGSGDKGRDVIGYVSDDTSPTICDVYQCKHYDKPITPGIFLPELAKLCVHTFNGTIPVPRFFFLVAPQDIGASLGELLEKPESIRDALVEKWEDSSKASSISKSIGKEEILLEGKLRSYVLNFDFSTIRHKPILEVIEELRHTPRYAQRFGGGLTKPLPPTPCPPSELSSNETRYVHQLLAVYRTDTNDETMNVPALLAPESPDVYSRHFKHSRERFYYAETLREFARDNLPEEFSYSSIQDDVYDGVIDTLESKFGKKLDLVRATTDMAAKVNVGSHPLKPYVKGQSLRGICHQLVNDDRMAWVSDAEVSTDES